MDADPQPHQVKAALEEIHRKQAYASLILRLENGTDITDDGAITRMVEILDGWADQDLFTWDRAGVRWVWNEWGALYARIHDLDPDGVWNSAWMIWQQEQSK